MASIVPAWEKARTTSTGFSLDKRLRLEKETFVDIECCLYAMGYSTDIDKRQHTFHVFFSYYFGILDLLNCSLRNLIRDRTRDNRHWDIQGVWSNRTNSVWPFLRQRRRKIHSKDFEGIWLSFLDALVEYSQNHPKMVCGTSRQKKTFRISWGVTWSNHSFLSGMNAT